MTYADEHLLQHVLVTVGWPRGFCGMHYGSGEQCNVHCLPRRIGFAVAARALEAYWPRWHQRMQRLHGADFFDPHTRRPAA